MFIRVMLLIMWNIIIKLYSIIFFDIKLYLESFKYSSIINLAKSSLHLKSSLKVKSTLHFSSFTTKKPRYLLSTYISNLLLTILTFILRCFALKVIFSLSDRYKILTND